MQKSEHEDHPLARWDNAAARNNRAALLELYADVYSVAPYADDPFFSVETYSRRLDGAMSMPGFEVVASTHERLLAGSCHGVTLPPTIPWWQDVTSSLSPACVEAAEAGKVLWLRELMVRRTHRGKGLGRALHDELCRTRTEECVALTVIVDNEPAQSAYLRWGYRIVGTIRHAPASPLYYAMLRGNSASTSLLDVHPRAILQT